MREGLRFLLLTLAGDKGTRILWNEVKKGWLQHWDFAREVIPRNLKSSHKFVSYFCYILVDVSNYEEVETPDTIYDFFFFCFSFPKY